MRGREWLASRCRGGRVTAAGDGEWWSRARAGEWLNWARAGSTRLKTAKLMISVAHPPTCATEMYDSVAHQLEGCATEFGGLTF